MMSEEWKVLFSEEPGELVVARRSRITSPGCYKSIDQIFINDYLLPEGQDKNDDEFFALARQIAAALNCHDDLLEALKEARAELQECSVELTGEDYNNPKMNAAIAKAEPHD